MISSISFCFYFDEPSLLEKWQNFTSCECVKINLRNPCIWEAELPITHKVSVRTISNFEPAIEQRRSIRLVPTNIAFPPAELVTSPSILFLHPPISPLATSASLCASSKSLWKCSGFATEGPLMSKYRVSIKSSTIFLASLLSKLPGTCRNRG